MYVFADNKYCFETETETQVLGLRGFHMVGKMAWSVIYKDGDADSPSNYRSITLLPIASKLQAK